MKRLLIAIGTAAVLAGCYTRTGRPTDGVVPTLTPAPSGEAVSAAPPAADSAKPDLVATPGAEDLQRTAAGVFGDTLVNTELIDVTASPEGPTWDIDVRSYETQERVAHYVNLFTQTSRTRFQERLRLGTRYEPMIRAKLRAGGIPEDMAYLALVESGFDPNAYSRAAAVGMWQFMTTTARDVGLRVDWWVDERRDPAKSTDGAIRFLRDLQNQFGSLYLAAAAYNGGPGRVSRGLTRFAEEMQGSEGEDRFFALAEKDYLRSETKNYVPQIIAAALVGKEPVRYGIQFDTLDTYMYDSVAVAAGTPLSAVASAAGVDLATIKELNPAVLRGMVPPTGALWIRVPFIEGVSSEEVVTALAALPEQERTGYTSLKAKGTETTASIAARAGITSKQLAWYNPGLKTRSGKILPGQNVRVPTRLVVAAAANVPDPSIERYGSSTAAATQGGSVHVVKRGESLGVIAARYKITVARLKALNGMRGDRIIAGQALRVRSTATAAKSTSAKRATSKSPSAKSTSAQKSVSKKPAPGKATAAKSAASKAAPSKATRAAASKKSTTQAAKKVAAPKKAATSNKSGSGN